MKKKVLIACAVVLGVILAAQQYLQHSPYRDAAIRFDVVEVTPAARGWQVHCIPGAFEC